MQAEIDFLLAALRSKHPTDVVKAGRTLLGHLAQHPERVSFAIHPVGFAHAKIATVETCDIRLHIWPIPPIPSQDPPWLVHCHPWPLTSYVLYGSVTNKEYLVISCPSGKHRLYSVTYDSGKSIMTATHKTVECRMAAAQDVDAGSQYEVATPVFHSTAANGTQPTATLAITGRPTRSRPLVVGSPNGKSEYQFLREQLPLDSAGKILSAFREAF